MSPPYRLALRECSKQDYTIEVCATLPHDGYSYDTLADQSIDQYCANGVLVYICAT